MTDPPTVETAVEKLPAKRSPMLMTVIEAVARSVPCASRLSWLAPLSVPEKETDAPPLSVAVALMSLTVIPPPPAVFVLAFALLWSVACSVTAVETLIVPEPILAETTAVESMIALDVSSVLTDSTHPSDFSRPLAESPSCD